jgi:hypothetical protein
MMDPEECNMEEIYNIMQTVHVNECISKYGPNHVNIM